MICCFKGESVKLKRSRVHSNCNRHLAKQIIHSIYIDTPKMYSIHNTLASSHVPTLVSCAEKRKQTNKQVSYISIPRTISKKRLGKCDPS
jgi:hypothetical protein